MKNAQSLPLPILVFTPRRKMVFLLIAPFLVIAMGWIGTQATKPWHRMSVEALHVLGWVNIAIGILALIFMLKQIYAAKPSLKIDEDSIYCCSIFSQEINIKWQAIAELYITTFGKHKILCVVENKRKKIFIGEVGLNCELEALKEQITEIAASKGNHILSV